MGGFSRRQRNKQNIRVVWKYISDGWFSKRKRLEMCLETKKKNLPSRVGSQKNSN